MRAYCDAISIVSPCKEVEDERATGRLTVALRKFLSVVVTLHLDAGASCLRSSVLRSAEEVSSFQWPSMLLRNFLSGSRSESAAVVRESTQDAWSGDKILIITSPHSHFHAPLTAPGLMFTLVGGAFESSRVRLEIGANLVRTTQRTGRYGITAKSLG